MRVDFETDVGVVRSSNQDSCDCGLFSPNSAWAIVCDGMGGANGGNVASSLTVRDLSRELAAQLRHAAPDEDPRPLMEAAIRHANALVNRASRDTAALRGMGTTLVLAVARGNRVTLAHAGDSRAYLVEGETLTQVTKDHTVVQMLMEQGEITAEQALTHPQRHYITRAVGVERELDAEFGTVTLLPGQALLLCSDGLYNYAPEESFPGLVRRAIETGDASCLIDAANAGGGGDNITAVILTGETKE